MSSHDTSSSFVANAVGDVGSSGHMSNTDSTVSKFVDGEHVVTTNVALKDTANSNTPLGLSEDMFTNNSEKDSARPHVRGEALLHGIGVGTGVGIGDGTAVGTGVGFGVGTGVGISVGIGVGTVVGTGVWIGVGTGVASGLRTSQNRARFKFATENVVDEWDDSSTRR